MLGHGRCSCAVPEEALAPVPGSSAGLRRIGGCRGAVVQCLLGPRRASIALWSRLGLVPLHSPPASPSALSHRAALGSAAKAAPSPRNPRPTSLPTTATAGAPTEAWSPCHHLLPEENPSDPDDDEGSQGGESPVVGSARAPSPGRAPQGRLQAPLRCLSSATFLLYVI